MSARKHQRTLFKALGLPASKKGVSKPTVVEEQSGQVTQAAKFRWWRIHVIKLNATELAAQLGYTERQIQRYEQGCGPNGKLMREQTWRRFRHACARLAKKSPFTFDWQ